MNKKNNKGFSLIELVIVITIMVILTALLAPQLLRYVEQSREAKDAVTMDELVRAVELSLTDETVYAAITKAETVTITNTGSPAKGVVACGVDAVKTELTKTLGTLTELPALVSKKYGTVQTVNINFDTTTKAVSVSYTKPS